MRKTIQILALTTLLAGATFSGCQSPSRKADQAEIKMQIAQQNLEEAQKEVKIAEARKAANIEEWETFKSNSEDKIRDMEISIAELKVKIKKSGSKLDALYEKKINTLEQNSKDLKAKIEASTNKSQSDLESFRREFSHDMDELGQALKDLTVNNKK